MRKLISKVKQQNKNEPALTTQLISSTRKKLEAFQEQSGHILRKTVTVPSPRTIQQDLVVFCQLPHELQVLILQYALADDPTEYLTHLGNGQAPTRPLETKREQLKALRLVDRVFHDAVTPAVFSSIHIHCSTLSIERAENIAKSRFAGYVREIVHHSGSFFPDKHDRKQFDVELTSHRTRGDYPKEYPFASPDVLYKNYLAEVEATNSLESINTERVRGLLQSFPNLVTILSVPYATEWLDPETSAYTLRRTGLSYLPHLSVDGPRSARNLAKATMVLRPKLLDLSLQNKSVVTEMAFENYPKSTEKRQVMAFCTDVHKLKLAAPPSGQYAIFGDSPSYIRALEHILHACQKLRHLELTNEFRPFGRYSAVVSKNGIPSLQMLTLSAGSMPGGWTEHELTDLIPRLGPSLKHVRFDRIAITSMGGSAPDLTEEVCDDFRSPTMPSSIRMLVKITSKTKLESLQGLLTLRCPKLVAMFKGKYVLSGPKPGREILVSKLEDAVCHRREWPAIVVEAAEQRPLRTGNRDHPGVAFLCAHWADTVDLFDVQDE